MKYFVIPVLLTLLFCTPTCAYEMRYIFSGTITNVEDGTLPVSDDYRVSNYISEGDLFTGYLVDYSPEPYPFLEEFLPYPYVALHTAYQISINDFVLSSSLGVEANAAEIYTQNFGLTDFAPKYSWDAYNLSFPTELSFYAMFVDDLYIDFMDGIGSISFGWEMWVDGKIETISVYSPNPVPEPGTMLLLSSGLVVLVIYRRKKNRGFPEWR